MRVFLVTPVTVLTDDVDRDVIVIIGRVVESDGPLLPGGFVELAPPEVEGVDVSGLEDPGEEDPGVEGPDVEDPGVDVSEVDGPAEDVPGFEDPGVEDAGVEVPGVENPGADEGVEDVVAGDPGVDVPEVEPGVEPGTDDPDLDDATVDVPGVEAPGVVPVLKLTDEPPPEDPLDDLGVGILEVLMKLPVGVIRVDDSVLEEELGVFVELPVDDP
jgi:hypothetical protein